MGDGKIIHNGRDHEHDTTVLARGDRVEFTRDFGPRNAEPYARAGEAGTVLGVVATREPLYFVELDADHDGRWPHTVRGEFLAPEGGGSRRKQKTKTVVNRASAEPRQH